MDRLKEARVPRWFWIVVSVALIWNLLGTTAYLAEAFGMAQSDAHKGMIAARPAWATGAYAIAVFAGVTGCVALLMRHRRAFPVLMSSFFALLVQQFWNFALNGAAVTQEKASMGFAGAVVLVSFGLVLLAWIALKKGWLRKRGMGQRR